METEDLCQAEAHCLRSDKPHGKSRQTKHLTGEQEWEEWKKKYRRRRRVEGGEGWAEVERRRRNNKSGRGWGGFLQMMKAREFALCGSDVDGRRPSGRSSDILQTLKSESEHRGAIQGGIITPVMLLRAHET